MITAGIGMLFLIIATIIGLAATVFWIWMLVSAIMNPRLSGMERLLWVLVIFFTHILGAIIYFFVGRKT
jgi:hypothetical protein